MFNGGFADQQGQGGGAFGAGGGPGGFFAQIAGLQQQQQQARQAPPESYDDYFKAYSTVMMGSRSERANLVHGGKIIMPPSALARLTNLDLESPWSFKLRNPKAAALETHAGVLEFIAEEGVVYLPPWMMRTLELGEGDPIRVTGARLPKGKRVKIQAQNLEFLEVSDPKAVLESCLRNFSCLSQGDMFSVSYNSIAFEFLVMETIPDGPGISCQDTDLEVDFAVPKGYVEPKAPEPKPVSTMASKLNIDVNSTVPSRAGSATGGGGDTSGDGEAAFEAFVGGGRTLNGRRTKGKGLTRKIEEVEKDSKIQRTDKPRIIPTSALSAPADKVPAALHLPHGKLFFGWTYKPFDPAGGSGTASSSSSAPAPAPFSTLATNGATLSGRAPRTFAPPPPPPSSAPAPAPSPAAGSSSTAPRVAPDSAGPEEAAPVDPWANLGSGGNTLNGRRAGAAGKSRAEPIEIDSD
ncbi:ubiquitin fusion degradation protein UFD1-domain-containing protein [Mrakia frigida]|uniref:polyubiquitin-binding protein UFD1 n=1 Tax=Mrakia frigida TaxID=29902 RepID=UPI003FCC0D3A